MTKPKFNIGDKVHVINDSYPPEMIWTVRQIELRENFWSDDTHWYYRVKSDTEYHENWYRADRLKPCEEDK